MIDWGYVGGSCVETLRCEGGVVRYGSGIIKCEVIADMCDNTCKLQLVVHCRRLCEFV